MPACLLGIRFRSVDTNLLNLNHLCYTYVERRSESFPFIGCITWVLLFKIYQAVFCLVIQEVQHNIYRQTRDDYVGVFCTIDIDGQVCLVCLQTDNFRLFLRE